MKTVKFEHKEFPEVEEIEDLDGKKSYKVNGYYFRDPERFEEWREYLVAIMALERHLRKKNPRPLATKVDRERVKELRRLPLREQARILKVSEKTVSRIRKELGISKGPHGGWTDAIKAEAKVMLEDRAGYEETSRTLGPSVRRLKKWYPGMGMTKEERGELLQARHIAQKAGIKL